MSSCARPANRDSFTATVTEGGTSLTRNQVVLDTPIKEVGLHDVRLSLHPEVDVTVTVNVDRSDDEAERQARGEVIGVDDDDDIFEEEETIAVEEVFEDEALAEEAVEELSDEGIVDGDTEADADDVPEDDSGETEDDEDETK